ncbi:Acetyl-CoA synthase corrinoid activation protein [Dissulfuribacter thermophilus]|uniref:Acetyl-CoA synthase corrinoid activation protein n=1 Tax=Dissulfuribacter thermophilus TaxID=1156395 RepID=A0A1B9F5T1_9BACT|nr:ASKHA domain-containing protein [Dissulfuribacter thermophilus]OCC15233.1 Acetyl-CoA synthase corrinoid activation protein [Dissulfuribacter thermophilus]
MPKVQFLPSGITIEIGPEDTLLKAAMKAGIHINASCGGAGVCNKCRVFVEKGKVEAEELPDGGIKACTATPVEDLVIRIPVESEMDRRALERSSAKATSWMREAQACVEYPKDPPVKKFLIELPEPSLSDQISDLERLMREVRQGKFKGASLEIDPEILYFLPNVVREGQWKITVTLKDLNESSNLVQLLRVEPGDKTKGCLSVAIDLGTTTISAELLETKTGTLLGKVSDYNPQVSFGEDVISRMEFARKPGGLQTLKDKITQKLSELIQELFSRARRDIQELSHLTIAGNTVMSHLLLGLETRYLRENPYIPVASHFPTLSASDIDFDLPSHVQCLLAPCVASYVGGDIVAGVIGVGIHKTEKLTLFIDIGTNGEIVLGNQDWMACAACSAGPAFEGGGIKHGMRATTGAVEVVHIHPETYEPMVLTIGRKRAKGICGSGIISLLAGLFQTGAIDRQGKFVRNLNTKRIREGRDGWEYVVVEKEATQIDADIVFTEADIENLIRAKGAMFAGYQTLLESVGMTVQDIDQVILAGNFGSYIDLEQAITIGLLPDIERDKFFFAGNTSLIGARAMALSKVAIEDAKRVADMMTHFDLSDNARFMDHYVSSLFLPHTDSSLFPSVKAP